MITFLRRLFWLALLAGAGYAVWTAWQRQHPPDPAREPEWPPIDLESSPADAPAAAAPAAAAPAAAAPAASATERPADRPVVGDTTWVDPLDDGSCPAGYPIMANDNSGIYHVPRGRFYDRTGPERCYARAEDAEADGYRAAKS
jgi:hypothetical protein